MFTRSIIDIYHGDSPVDLGLLANNGVVACMMKATQGVVGIDPMFKDRLAMARAVGLLAGSYHFATGEDPIKQAAHWLDVANPVPSDALELDWEKNPNGTTMSYAQACIFVAEMFRLTGRYPLLYGSNFLKEIIPPNDDSILFRCPLSLASYTSVPKLPRGWDHYTLWQYTGDGQNVSISPHTFPGATAPLDIYQFDGTIAELRAQWPFSTIPNLP